MQREMRNKYIIIHDEKRKMKRPEVRWENNIQTDS
jgi:hypothetical protein